MANGKPGSKSQMQLRGLLRSCHQQAWACSSLCSHAALLACCVQIITVGILTMAYTIYGGLYISIITDQVQVCNIAAVWWQQHWHQQHQ